MAYSSFKSCATSTALLSHRVIQVFLNSHRLPIHYRPSLTSSPYLHCESCFYTNTENWKDSTHIISAASIYWLLPHITGLRGPAPWTLALVGKEGCNQVLLLQAGELCFSSRGVISLLWSGHTVPSGVIHGHPFVSLLTMTRR